MTHNFKDKEDMKPQEIMNAIVHYSFHSIHYMQQILNTLKQGRSKGDKGYLRWRELRFVDLIILFPNINSLSLYNAAVASPHDQTSIHWLLLAL